MSNSFLALLSRSFSLELQPDRRQQTDRRAGWRGGRRAGDLEELAKEILARHPVAGGTSRYTWVHDRDTLEQHYVN